MPNAQHNPAIDARRFAALLAGFDLGNACEEEALSKGRALRRMAASAGLRIVDALELPEVKCAVNDQLHPARTEGSQLQEALERAEALGEELTERTRDVRELAELLTQAETETEVLRGELARAQSRPAAGRAASVISAPSPGAQHWAFEAGTVLLALTFLLAAFCGGNFQEKSDGTGLGNRQGHHAAVVRAGRAVRHVPKPRTVRHRLRDDGPSARAR